MLRLPHGADVDVADAAGVSARMAGPPRAWLRGRASGARSMTCLPKQPPAHNAAINLKAAGGINLKDPIHVIGILLAVVVLGLHFAHGCLTSP